MTETGPGSHMCPRSRQKPGSVGVIVPNTECKVRSAELSRRTVNYSASVTGLVQDVTGGKYSIIIYCEVT